MSKQKTPLSAFDDDATVKQRCAITSSPQQDQSTSHNNCSDGEGWFVFFTNPSILERMLRSCSTAHDFGSLARVNKLSRALAAPGTRLCKDAKVAFATARWETIRTSYYTAVTTLTMRLPNGWRHGLEVVSSDTTDAVCFERQWIDDKQHGCEKEYWPPGVLKAEYYWINNEKHGRQMKWNSEGTPKRESYWVNGKKHGVQKRWYSHGRYTVRHWRNGMLQGAEKSFVTAEAYSFLQQLIIWKDGKQHGTQTCWYDSGVKSYECVWLNGNQHGTETYWTRTGVKNYECLWINGKQCGTEIGDLQKNVV